MTKQLQQKSFNQEMKLQEYQMKIDEQSFYSQEIESLKHQLQMAKSQLYEERNQPKQRDQDNSIMTVDTEQVLS